MNKVKPPTVMEEELGVLYLLLGELVSEGAEHFAFVLDAQFSASFLRYSLLPEQVLKLEY